MPPPAEGLASRLFLGPALRTQPDRRLVTLVREGYEAAFEEIVRRYGRPLGRYAASIVGGRSEDVLQEAFAKALPALQRDDAEIDLRPWLFRIVRNTALNELRDSPPSPELLAEALAGGGRNPADELEQREQLTDLIRRLRALPEPQRAAIVMRELEGLSHEEIAAALGLSGGGARQAIYRARQALRNGAGMLLPLPLVRMLIDYGGEAAGAGAGGAIAAAGVSAGGAGGALKLGVVAVVVAGSVGAGVAAQSHRDDDTARAQAAAPTARSVAVDGSGASSAPATALIADDNLRSGADRRGEGSSGHHSAGDSRDDASGDTEDQSGRHSGGSGEGPGPPLDTSGHRGGGSRDRDGDDHGVHGGGPGPEGHGDSSGPRRESSGNSGGETRLDDGGHEGSDSGPGSGDDSGHSGPGSGGETQGDGGSGSNRGSGADTPPPPEETAPEGSGGSGHSGHSGEDSSNSGPGDGGREYE